MTGPDAELMRRTLATVLEQIEKDRASLDGQAPDPVGAAAVDANRLVASMLDQILERVADRHRRDPIAISVISPQMGTDDPPVEKKLAGEFAFISAASSSGRCGPATSRWAMTTRSHGWSRGWPATGSPRLTSSPR